MKTVLITGISGWLAQFCAVEALRKGYQVRGSLRNLKRISEVEAVLAPFVSQKNQLTFVELDLTEDNGWDSAMSECKYVLHVASPYVVAEPKDQNDLILPAKEGTLRALTHAKKHGVKRLVLTSSCVAMNAHMSHGEFNHESWSDLNSSFVNAYQHSKTIAEQAAWEYYHQQDEDHKLELAVINPGAIIGPTLNDDLESASLKFITTLLQGKLPGLPNVHANMVDVRDVAEHHLKAMTLPEAEGKRFISAQAHPESFLKLAQILQNHGFQKVTTRRVPTFLLKLLSFFDREAKGMLGWVDTKLTCDISQTVNILGWTPTPTERSIIDMAESIKRVLAKNKSSI